MEGVSFSIIIPIYNSEKTLKRCLNSVAHQTFSEYEVLMIDDGSTDGSSSVCAWYSNHDQRFRYFSMTNSGPSAARNKGLENARGEYIAFVDSDDYVSENYLEKLYAVFSEQNADVVFLSYRLIGREERIVRIPELEKNYYNDLITLSEANMFGYTWIKAFRKSMIKDIRFQNDFKIMEDEMFTCEVLKQECNVSTVNEPIYDYVQGESSLIDKLHDNYCEACENVYHRWKSLLSEYDKKKSLEFLERKCNSLANNCKYYGLEKPVNVIEFYKRLLEFSFFRDSTTTDALISAIKKNEWNKVKYLCNKYKLKSRIVKLMK